MTFFEFVQKYNGKIVDVDGAFGGQCVDLMRKYCEEVLGVGLYALPRGDAGDIYNKVSDPRFKKTRNLPWNSPQQGDIIFWGRSKSLPFGHVAIVNTANVFRVSSFDQNWGSDKSCRIVDNHNYSGCQGWARKVY